MRHLSTIDPRLILVVVLAVAAGAAPLHAATRSVTIIQGADEPTEPIAPDPSAAAPLALNTQNAAGVRLSILPGADLPLGTRIAFSVSSQRAGYLVLVDINAEGRITQIFPNMMSLAQSSGDVAAANLVKAGAEITVPNAKNPLARFTFTADEPRGPGAIVAMLSDHPVQLIDLPDLSPSPGGLQATVDALDSAVAGLKIAAAGRANAFVESSWSFAAVPYTIR